MSVWAHVGGGPWASNGAPGGAHGRLRPSKVWGQLTAWQAKLPLALSAWGGIESLVLVLLWSFSCDLQYHKSREQVQTARLCVPSRCVPVPFCTRSGAECLSRLSPLPAFLWVHCRGSFGPK